jgi:hypothetical protein
MRGHLHRVAVAILEGAPEGVLMSASPCILLPEGKDYVTVAEIPGLIAEALYPGKGEADSLRRAAAEEEHKRHLQETIREGKLVTRSQAMVPFKASEGTLPQARVPADVFAEYVSGFGFQVRRNAAPEILTGEGTLTPLAQKSPPEPIVRLRSSPPARRRDVSSSRRDLTRSAMARLPNWPKWCAVADVQIWEGVALSLNIEPDRVDRDRDPFHLALTDHDLPFNESQEFKDRIFVATRNMGGGNKPLRPTSMGDEPFASCVAFQQFAAWAIGIGWQCPEEFTGLAAPHDRARHNSQVQREARTSTPGTNSAVQSISQRAEAGYLNTIGALLDLLLSKGGDGRGLFPSEAAIINAIAERYPGKSGLAQRTLEERFAQAKRTLKVE